MLKGYYDWLAMLLLLKKKCSSCWNKIASPGDNTWKLLSWNTWAATKHSFRLIINTLIITTNTITSTAIISDHLYIR